MTKSSTSLAACAAALFLQITAPARAADLANGEAAFRPCGACHSLVAGQTKTGPSLHGLFGRTAGTLEGFNYSSAMRASGLIWNEAALARYLHSPKDVVPGTRMAFAGIKDDTRLQDLIAYLKQATQ
jgi:cytochrome c